MVSAVDDGVGRVLAKLRETGLDKNTLVVFISDNGGPLADNGSSNGSLRGKKGGLFEGGIRIPFAMRWPEKIPAGTVYDRPVITFDILATVLGNIPAAPRPKHAIDGIDLLPFVTGKTNKAPHPYLFWRQYDQKSYAVIRSDHKKLLIRADTASLFDLGIDRSETNDLAREEKAVVKALRKKISAWEKELKPPSFLGLSQRAEYIRTRSSVRE
jgi:arylsulfatase A-like enzyme